MFGLIESGGSAVVIDDGYSFRNSCEVLGGTHIDFSDNQLQLNPFAAIDADAMQADADFSENVYSMLTAFIMGLAHPGGAISDIERAIITDAVQQVWKIKGREGKIDHVVLLLSKQDDDIARQLVKLLLPFTSTNAYGRLFSGGCNIDLSHDLVVFEMSAVRDKSEIQAASMVLLIFLATQKMYHSPKNKHVSIMIDEAWSLLGGTSADFIEGVARRARKYSGSLICATQSVEDFFTSKSTEAAWANSEWAIMLKQKDSSIDALKSARRIRVDDEMERALRSLETVRGQYSELALISSVRWDVCQLRLDDVSLTAFSSSGEDVQAIEELIRSGLSRSEAITQHAQKIAKSRGNRVKETQ